MYGIILHVVDISFFGKPSRPSALALAAPVYKISTVPATGQFFSVILLETLIVSFEIKSVH